MKLYRDLLLHQPILQWMDTANKNKNDWLKFKIITLWNIILLEHRIYLASISYLFLKSTNLSHFIFKLWKCNVVVDICDEYLSKIKETLQFNEKFLIDQSNFKVYLFSYIWQSYNALNPSYVINHNSQILLNLFLLTH